MYASGIQVKSLWVAIAVLAVALAVVVIWTTTGSPPSPAVLTAERLEIVEPDGSLAIVLANSRRPPVGTINGQVIMEGQEEERRGIPSIVFFDGKGDEVGGMAFGVRGAGDEFQAIRHIALDAHEQDQAVVLMHHQDPSGSMSGLSVSDLPAHSLPDALAELGLAVGASRQQLQPAIMQIPEDERGSRLGELFGTPRAFLGSTHAGEAALTLRDGGRSAAHRHRSAR